MSLFESWYVAKNMSCAIFLVSFVSTGTVYTWVFPQMQEYHNFLHRFPGVRSQDFLIHTLTQGHLDLWSWWASPTCAIPYFHQTILQNLTIFSSIHLPLKLYQFSYPTSAHTALYHQVIPPSMLDCWSCSRKLLSPSFHTYSGSKKCPNVCLFLKDQTGVIFWHNLATWPAYLRNYNILAF